MEGPDRGVCVEDCKKGRGCLGAPFCTMSIRVVKMMKRLGKAWFVPLLLLLILAAIGDLIGLIFTLIAMLIICLGAMIYLCYLFRRPGENPWDNMRYYDRKFVKKITKKVKKCCSCCK